MFGRSDKDKQYSILAGRVRSVARPIAPSVRSTVTRGFGRQSRSERAPTFREGNLLLAGGTKERVVVRNISATGARVDFFSAGALSSRVLLSARSLGIQRWARVVWSDAHSAGLEFE